jgi:Domain of unknown function (DUF4105)
VKRALGRLTRWIGFAVLAVVILSIGAWCTLAVWFRVPTAEPLRGTLAGLVFVLALAAVGFLATSRRWLIITIYAASVGVVLAWWTTIRPSNDRDWAPDVARNVTAAIDGDRLTVNNVRDFSWRSDTDFDQRWELRTYSPSHLTNVDLIMSYWGNEAIAHTIVSFGFTDGSRLAFSIETRKERGEAYSPIAGFFKQYELAIIAADERDIVRVRSNVRGEDVRLYRLRMTPTNAQMLLREYVKEANDLARAPRFYDTLTSNCTTLVFKMVRVIHPGLPMDYRVLLSGYLPVYAYSLGATDTSMPFEELRDLSRIHDKALRADTDRDFSAKIREGVPEP